jgi:hypothetical protein
MKRLPDNYIDCANNMLSPMGYTFRPNRTIIRVCTEYKIERQCTYNVTLRRVRVTIAAVENITYSECVYLALVIQHAMRMRSTVICTLPGSTIFFSHYLINGMIFEKKKIIEHKMRAFPLQILSETFLILRRIKRYDQECIYWSSCKMHFMLVRFWINLNFIDSFSKNIQIRDFTKIRPVGYELLRTDGQTWRS